VRRLLADGDGHSLACALDAYWGAGGCFRGVVIGRIRWSSAPVSSKDKSNQTASTCQLRSGCKCMQLYCTHAAVQHANHPQFLTAASCRDPVCLFLRFVSEFRPRFGLRSAPSGVHGWSGGPKGINRSKGRWTVAFFVLYMGRVAWSPLHVSLQAIKHRAFVGVYVKASTITGLLYLPIYLNKHSLFMSPRPVHLHTWQPHPHKW